MQALHNPPGDETRRLFHGRGRCWPGLEQITVDWLSGIVLVMLFREPDAALRPLLLELLDTPEWQASGARGLLLQQLPAHPQTEPQEREESWNHVLTLADTLTAEELLGLDNPTLLHRLYHEENVRLFDEQLLQFRCSCSRERSASALISLGQTDAELLLAEQGGQVEIDCQFCNERYLFDAADIAQLFAGAGSEAPSQTRH